MYHAPSPPDCIWLHAGLELRNRGPGGDNHHVVKDHPLDVKPAGTTDGISPVPFDEAVGESGIQHYFWMWMDKQKPSYMQ